MVDIQNIRQVIKDKINKEIDWANPYWLDWVKEEYPGIPERAIDDIYAEEMKCKVVFLRKEEAHTILDEQNSLTSANQNYLLQHLIEEKLELTSNL